MKKKFYIATALTGICILGGVLSVSAKEETSTQASGFKSSLESIQAAIENTGSFLDISDESMEAPMSLETESLASPCIYGHENCDGNHTEYCAEGHANCDGNHTEYCAEGHANCDGNHTEYCAQGHANCNGNHNSTGTHHGGGHHRGHHS